MYKDNDYKKIVFTFNSCNDTGHCFPSAADIDNWKFLTTLTNTMKLRSCTSIKKQTLPPFGLNSVSSVKKPYNGFNWVFRELIVVDEQ